MYDGAELGRALAAHPGDADAAVLEYELALFPRSTDAATKSAEVGELLSGEEGTDRLIEVFADFS
jgi:hypothetical protein